MLHKIYFKGKCITKRVETLNTDILRYAIYETINEYPKCKSKDGYLMKKYITYIYELIKENILCESDGMSAVYFTGLMNGMFNTSLYNPKIITKYQVRGQYPEWNMMSREFKDPESQEKDAKEFAEILISKYKEREIMLWGQEISELMDNPVD